MRRIVIAVPLIAFCISACAATASRPLAAGQNPDPAQLLKRADANGDGQISEAEFKQARDTLFTRLDHNGDGYLTKDDTPRRLTLRSNGDSNGARMTEALSRMDKDGDGRISRSEFVNGPSKLFSAADSNHDGVVDAHELQALSAAAAAHQGQ
jgi:Ca2+-binding EF-hand superfamily protein